MDFFLSQDKARRNSKLLILYFTLAVLCIIAAIYLGIAFFLEHFSSEIEWQYPLWNTKLFLIIASVTSIILLSGTFFKISELSSKGTGHKIASMINAKPVNPNTSNIDEKKLLNIVEEMAIASGIAVPSVYIIPDQSINAFAAGYTPNDAVVAVTQGALSMLTREELQSVVAHEFSHIFNGDMRLNVRLIGIINGIILFAVIGSLILRLLGRIRYSGGSSRRNRKGGGGGGIIVLILVIGIVFYIIGSIGQFFATLIQRAFCRQREFLADACAIQYTRNPVGLLGVLNKINDEVNGSYINNANAKTICHLFFADGLHRKLSRLFSTHPPLLERIKRIEPLVKTIATEQSTRLTKESFSGAVPFQSSIAAAATVAPAVTYLSSDVLVKSVGTIPTESHIEYASALISTLPPEIVKNVRETFGARAVVLMLLVDNNNTSNAYNTQMNILSANTDESFVKLFQQLLADANKIKPHQRLPLLEMTFPSLRELSKSQWKSFIRIIDLFILADKRISVFEFTLWQLVVSQYSSLHNDKNKQKEKFSSINAVAKDISLLLSILAWYSSNFDSQKAMSAFKRAVSKLENNQIKSLPFENLTVAMLEIPLRNISKAYASIRKLVMMACVECITSDNTITVEEAELIRAIGSTINCPVPPLISNYTT